jgi:mRNA-degrading endonuclease RelE of RelBE toxin-antitoxin system
MTEPPAPQRVGVLWSPEARADLRAIDRDQALQILYCLSRYLTNRIGDVKKLKPPLTDVRLRCGDYRVFFDRQDSNSKSAPSAIARTLTADDH